MGEDVAGRKAKRGVQMRLSLRAATHAILGRDELPNRLSQRVANFRSRQQKMTRDGKSSAREQWQER